MPTLQDEEVDSLRNLEERITRAVEVVAELRKERESLHHQLQAALAERDAARQEAGSAASQAESTARELEELRNERKQVRTRIEKLLGQMDLLSAT